MRLLILACLLGFVFNVTAQDSIKVKTPKIIMQKKVNQAMVYEDVAITLVRILEDSRCPQGVNCVRAGEVKAIVEIVEAGKTRKMREIVVQANTNPNQLPVIYQTKTKHFFAVNILPYPKFDIKIAPEDYTIQIEARKY